MAITIRKSTIDDLPEIQRVYEYARRFMRETGNPNQWKTTNPPLEVILKDFEDGTGYVIEKDGKIGAVFAFLLGEDPTYGYIEDGQWLSDEPYGTIHRIANDGTISCVVKLASDYAEKTIKNLRFDTHHDNKIMQHVLEKNGFKRCGIIYLENGEERIAYQRFQE